MNKTKGKLKKKFTGAMIALLIAFAAAATATFAWYIYNTTAHTTNVSLAAGTASSLLISKAYDGEYNYSVVMDPFYGSLTPVSTNKITNGFQHVTQFTEASGSDTKSLAYIFEDAPASDYYTRTLYLKSTNQSRTVYVSDIEFENSDDDNPISTAIRVGLVVYEPGNTSTIKNEFIFAIDPNTSNPHQEYNTSTGEEGYVLNSATWDNTTIKFDPLTPDDYCKINSESGEIEKKGTAITTCDDTPVRIDTYIWLEGCDKDCTRSLMGTTLKNVALNFAGDGSN